MSSAEKGEQTREQILKAINSYINEHQYPPTTREIGDMVGLKSTCSVNHHIQVLLRCGELETDHGFGASRALRVPSRAAEIDALYLAKCQEVNELRAQIENMAVQREADCCEWKQEKFLEFSLSDCVTSCGHAEHYSVGIDKYCRHCGKPIKIAEVE